MRKIGWRKPLMRWKLNSTPICISMAFLRLLDEWSLAVCASETDGDQPSKSKQRTIAAKNTSLKWELKKLLARPLIAKGVSPKYITSGSRDIAGGLLAGERMFSWPLSYYSSNTHLSIVHKSMVGLRKSGAGVDVSKKKQKRKVRPFRSHT